MAEPRNSFGPVVLTGLVSGVLTAVACARPWLRASGDAAGVRVTAEIRGTDAAPLAAALALVALAAWGVLLVTRGWVRQVAAVIGVAAAVGSTVAVAAAFADAHQVALQALNGRGATTVSRLSRQPWYFLSAIGGVFQTAAFVVAFRWAPSWPAMGSRYDAPGGAGERPALGQQPGDRASADPATDHDLWQALDEGLDPTARSDPPAAP
ncbi:MAG: Trp biosynthesis-associated membrane protein [Actinomycetota bacterium]|nr:Trp biosynthesis-associated membrane protein [Actinomycetota bacterium]